MYSTTSGKAQTDAEEGNAVSSMGLERNRAL